MDIRAIKKKFLALNQERYKRSRATLRPNQQDLIEAIPLLFHINHPALPGYVSPDTPAGILNYEKEGPAIMAAQRLLKGFEYRRSVSFNYDIQAMFLIGSSGTIAHSTKSDFDIWLCHSSDLTNEQIQELREKGEKIEKWAESFNLEVHFFLMDAERFRSGEVLDLSSESSGTAQHDLLLDEFYRTALWLVGAIPMWWLVPPEEEVNYDEYAANLLKKRYVQPSEVIDFGGLGNIPSEEFFGAAVWQIYKGVDSPYKSVLKILSMEIYANEYPKVDFLSLMYKREVYKHKEDEDINLNQVDPYIMLLEKLTEYLEKREDFERLDLVRRCFYFKINMPLSKMRYQPGANWQQDLLMQMTREWGWRLEYLRNLDGRNEWKIDKITHERKLLVKELTQSYFALSEFAREQAGLAMISQKDLNVLGRKLYAAFERKTGKIEIINKGFSADLHESLVSLAQRKGQGGRDNWFLYRSEGLQTDEDGSLPLKRASSVMELICWAYFNKLIDRRSSYAIKRRGSELNERETSAIVKMLAQHFPDGNIPYASIEDFAEKPKLAAVHLFVNVGTGAPGMWSRLGHLITDQTDALCFGNIGENMVTSVDAVFITSWQEVLVYHYEGSEGLMDCLSQYLQWSPLAEKASPPKAVVHCFSSTYSDKISRRVKELFDSVRDAFYQGDDFMENPLESNLRYVFAVKQGYAMLYIEDGVVRHHSYASYQGLTEALGRARAQYSAVRVDSQARQGLLAAVYHNDKPGVIQFYFRVVSKNIELLVLDEKGSLFQQTLPLSDPKMILQHYYTFLNSIVKRQTSTLENGITDHSRVECYQILSSGKKGIPVLEKRDIRFALPNEYFNVQVIGDTSGADAGFTVYCNDREFSSSEYGDETFAEVAKHILAQRKSGQRYPIYITDVDLPESLLGVESAGSVQTLHYLRYKKNVEVKLNQVVSLTKLPA